jgi:hypothetical protein
MMLRPFVPVSRISFLLGAMLAAGLALVWLFFLAPDADETSRGAELQSGGAAERALSTDAEPRASASAVERRDESAGAAAAAPEGELRVLCLAVDGTPVPGLEVEVRPLDRSGERPLQIYFSGRADAEGRLCFAGARDVLLREEAPHGWALTTAEFRPWVVPLRLDLERDFERVVEWRLPPFGAVEVRVLDPRGSPVPDGTVVALEEADDAKTREVTSACSGGVARFERLGLSTLFDVRARVDLGADVPSLRVEGLSHHGELRRVELRIGAQETWLSARVLAVDGEPLSAERLRIQLVTVERDLLDLGGRTDREGVLLVSVEKLERDAPRQLLLRRREQAQSLLVDLPAVVRGATNELGELRLLQDELIACGQVLDAEGLGVPSAYVEARPLEVSPPASRHPLRERQAPRAIISEDGRFELREPDLRDAAPPRYLLCARESGGVRCSVPLEVARGATNVVLRLVAAGGVAGLLLLPEGLPSGALNLVLVDGAGVPFPTSDFLRGAETWLHADALPPGSYTLQLRLAAWHEPIAVLSGLVVPSGGVCSDPRLRPLDLRPHVHVIELDLERADGAPLAFPGTLELRERSAALGAPRSVFVRSKRFCAALPARPFLGTLRLDGCEPVELDLAAPRQRVFLRPR